MPATWNLASVSQSQKGGKGLFETPEKPLSTLFFIRVGQAQEYHHIVDFVKFLKKELPSYKLGNQGIHHEVGVPTFVESDAQTRRMLVSKTMDEATDKLVSLAKGPEGATPSLIFVLLPSSDATTYSDIHWWADCVRGVPICCITGDTLRKARFGGRGGKPDQTVLAHICLKINFKLGGRNHALGARLGLKGPTMIVGGDVTHSGKGSDPGSPSLAGIVACNGENSSDYLASARLQSNNTEFMEDLKGMMCNRLGDYYKTQKNSLPAHILFYRDGVSESQYGMVTARELPQIDAAINDVRNGLQLSKEQWDPKVTLLVVGKRHHARFFPMDPKSDKNLPAGTCIDNTIIAPNQFSFYLQSHDSPIGTARTGHYDVLRNDSGYNAREIQSITHSLAFTGSRATKGLSVAAPARYADILCDRLRCYMKPVLDGELWDKLWDCEVATYEKEKLIWGTKRMESGGMGNPWSDKVARRMFYL